MPTLEDVERLIESKAARIGLSLASFNLLMELCADLEDHAGIQALAYARPVLTLMSLSAEYRVSLADGCLECHFSDFDTHVKTRAIWSGDDSVQSFEGLREVILNLEGYDVSVVHAETTQQELVET